MSIVPLFDQSLAEFLHSLDQSSDVVTLLPHAVKRNYQPRYELQAFVQEHTASKSLRMCRRGYRVLDAEGVATRVPCRNSWLCPVCTQRKLTEWTTKSLRLLDSAPSALSFTFTQIQENEPLAVSLARLKGTLKAFTSGKAWDTLRKTYGIVGIGYVIELKHSPEGWHPHAHGYVIAGSRLTAGQADKLALALRRRWTHHSAGSSIWGQDVHFLDSEDYYASTGYLKKDNPRFTTDSPTVRTLGDLLHDASRGDLDALDLWREAERATVGQRRYSWTPAIEKRLAEATSGILSA